VIKFRTFYLAEAYSAKVIKILSDKFKKENDALTDTQIAYYIKRFEKVKQSPKIIEKDITKYTFKELENIIDSNFPPEKTSDSKKIDNNDAIYDEDGLTIYNGDSREKCVKYGSGEAWCISRKDSSNMFNSYRYRFDEINFYFIFDSERDDEFSKVVLLIDKDNNYYLASRKNSGNFAGSKRYSWDQIVEFVPKIKNLKKLFKPLPLTAEEREVYNLVKNRTNEELFKKFGKYDIVEKYISFLHELKTPQFNALPAELKMKYINTGNRVWGTMQLTSKEWMRFCEVQLQANDGHIYMDFEGPFQPTFKLPNTYIKKLNLHFKGGFPDDFKFPNEIDNLLLGSLSELDPKIKLPETIDGELNLSSITKIPDNYVFPKKVGTLSMVKVKIGDGVKFPEEVTRSFSVNSIESFGKNIQWPKKLPLNGSGYLSMLNFKDRVLPNNFEFPDADFRYNFTEIPEGYKFPKKMRHFVFDRVSRLPKTITFPEVIEGDFIMRDLIVIREDITFPKTVKGDFSLEDLGSVSANVTWPETIGGSFVLGNLKEITVDTKFPKEIGNDFYLNRFKSFTSSKTRVKWPETIKGNLDLSRLDNFPRRSVLPKTIGGDLIIPWVWDMDNVEVEIEEWPETIGGIIALRTSQENSYTTRERNLEAKEEHDEFIENVLRVVPTKFHKHISYNHHY